MTETKIHEPRESDRLAAREIVDGEWVCNHATVTTVEELALVIARAMAEEREREERAIEHGGYLATAAEGFMQSLNTKAENPEDEGNFDLVNDHWRALQSCVYEFRKRARAALEGKP